VNRAALGEEVARGDCPFVWDRIRTSACMDVALTVSARPARTVKHMPRVCACFWGHARIEVATLRADGRRADSRARVGRGLGSFGFKTACRLCGQAAVAAPAFGPAATLAGSVIWTRKPLAVGAGDKRRLAVLQAAHTQGRGRPSRQRYVAKSGAVVAFRADMMRLARGAETVGLPEGTVPLVRRSSSPLTD